MAARAHCLILPAPLAGPAAIYFGVRARRTPDTAISTWSIALGAIGLILFFMYVISLLSGAGNTTGTTP